MNIAIFTDTYRPSISGVVSSIDLFADELERRGHKVYIFAPTLKDEKGKVIHSEGRVVRLFSVEQDFVPEFNMTLPFLDQIFKEFSKFKIDIIHSQTPFYMGLYASFVSLALNIPIVHTYHTLYEEFMGHSLFRDQEKIDETVMKLAKQVSVFHSNRCDLVIAPSEKVKNILEKKYRIKSEIAILPTGIDLEKFKKIDKKVFRQKHNISAETKVLLYLGRIAKEKNIEFLIRSLTDVLKNDKNVLLILAGDGPGVENVKAVVEELDLKDKVLLPGYLRGQEVFDCFTAADVFVFASKTDTQSLVLQEAVASGLPVVMLEDRELTGVVQEGKNALIIRNNSASDFASQVRSLLHDQAKHDRMSSESKRIIQDFSIQELTTRLEEIYRRAEEFHRLLSWRSRLWTGITRERRLPNFKKSYGILKKFFNKIIEQ